MFWAQLIRQCILNYFQLFVDLLDTIAVSGNSL